MEYILTIVFLLLIVWLISESHWVKIIASLLGMSALLSASIGFPIFAFIQSVSSGNYILAFMSIVMLFVLGGIFYKGEPRNRGIGDWEKKECNGESN